MIPKGKGEYRSHGFRPRRSAHHAIEQMHAEALAKGKKCDVVDCDLKAFFETVDHQKLMVAPPHETYYWNQWGRPRTRRRNLLKLGIARGEVHRASRARKGHWCMTQNELVRWAMNNQWLEEQGLLDLEKEWCSIRYPEGPKRPKW